MIRWLVVWRLRRARDRLSDRVEWLRDCEWSARIAKDQAEDRLREAQARLWCVEAPQKLLKPHRRVPESLEGGGS